MSQTARNTAAPGLFVCAYRRGFRLLRNLTSCNYADAIRYLNALTRASKRGIFAKVPGGSFLGCRCCAFVCFFLGASACQHQSCYFIASFRHGCTEEALSPQLETRDRRNLMPSPRIAPSWSPALQTVLLQQWALSRLLPRSWTTAIPE